MKIKQALFTMAMTLAIVSLSPRANRQNNPCPTPTVYPPSSGFQPKILQRDQAFYTVKARDNKIQGTVVLQAVFHESGKVADIIVIHGLPYGLTEQAIGTAYMIKFTPAIKDGRPVSVRGNLEYSFKLY